MIFKERQKRAMDTMNHRNKEYLEKMNGPLPDGGEENQEIPVRQVDDNPFSKDNLEKGDLSAMVISALLTFLPDFVVKVRRYVLTYFLTSSSLERLNSLRILDALFGPLILGFSISVNPGKSLSPFFTITKFKTERSGLTMQPRTDFLRRSPLRLPYPRKHGVPLWSKRRTRPGVSTPCFIGKPCLSQPPVILKTYPLNSSPRASPLTSCEILLSQNARSF